jgi:hypothetical protein
MQTKMIQAMKFNPVKLIATLLFIGAITFSCEKTEDTPANADLDEDTAMDITTLEDLTASVEAEIDDSEENNSAPCVDVTISPDDGTFPRTKTIDFGEGCVGKNGRTFRGIIQVVYSDTARNPGATRTVSFQDFSIDDAQITGSKVLTNVSEEAGRLTAISRNVDLNVLFPNAESASWKLDQVYQIIEGAETWTRLDDVMELTGSASGIDREGNTFTTTITEPLLRRRTCPWIGKGIRSVTVNGENFTIDYGEGDCNRVAILTNDENESKEIRIRSWWK